MNKFYGCKVEKYIYSYFLLTTLETVDEPIIDFRLSRDQTKETQKHEPLLPKQKRVRNKRTRKVKQMVDDVIPSCESNISESKFNLRITSAYDRSVTPPLEMLMFPQRTTQNLSTLESTPRAPEKAQTIVPEMPNLQISVNLSPKNSVSAISLQEWAEKLPHSTLDDFCEQIICNVDKFLE